MDSIPPEILTTLITGMVGAVVAYLEKIRRDLAANTKATHETKAKAEKAEQTSNGRLTEQIRMNQHLQWENYTLRRLIDALEMDQAGLSALSNARARLEMLKTLAPGGHTPAPAIPPKEEGPHVS